MKKDTLIWDLSGTLFRPQSDTLTAQQKEDYSFVFLIWSGKREPSDRDAIAYKVLDLLGEQSEPDPTQLIRDHTGKPIPEVICAYLAGRIQSTQAAEQTLSFYDVWASSNVNIEDQEPVRRMLQTFFDPHALVTCMRPIEVAVELFRKTVEHNDSLYILSNWDSDSFGPLYDRYKNSVFAGIPRDHIVISADTGFVKPQRGIYEWLLSNHHLNPNRCFFIDDQEENIKAAHLLGIEGQQFSEESIDSLEYTLQEHLLL